MRVAVINEVSTANRNEDIVAALDRRGLDLVNVGMKHAGSDQPELTYIHTGFLAALLLNTHRADFVVGGCGTGHGFQISVSQYPGVSCGHIVTPLDAWLFARINAGNCASLPLNQGYGWGAEVNLGLIFDQLFTNAAGTGHPENRKASQAQSRDMLAKITLTSHRTIAEIIVDLPADIVQRVLTYPGVMPLLDIDRLEDEATVAALNQVRPRNSGDRSSSLA
jgi:ribose 5-phosphate isomerase RpiB